MGRREVERAALVAAPDREAYLLSGSHLPGPRANLELLDAAGDVLTRDEALAWSALGPDDAVPNTPREFLACCGVVALGRLVVEGDRSLVERLRRTAADPRWRVRESVSIALQRWGDADTPAMVTAIEPWSQDPDLLVRRAAVAAICEPRLLREPAIVAGAVRILATATAGLVGAAKPRGEPGRVLGAALGYGWSVAIAADPAIALPAFARWFADAGDADLRRVLKENLTKARFVKAAPAAVEELRARLP